MAAPQGVVIVTQTQGVISPDTKSVLLAKTRTEEKSLKITRLVGGFHCISSPRMLSNDTTAKKCRTET